MITALWRNQCPPTLRFLMVLHELLDSCLRRNCRSWGCITRWGEQHKGGIGGRGADELQANLKFISWPDPSPSCLQTDSWLPSQRVLVFLISFFGGIGPFIAFFFFLFCCLGPLCVVFSCVVRPGYLYKKRNFLACSCTFSVIRWSSDLFFSVEQRKPCASLCRDGVCWPCLPRQGCCV
jgi:hypothetical protein